MNHRSGAPVSPELLETMCALLAHRGPDGQGVHASGAVGLGHRRLAVLDPTDAGRQPMATADGRLRIVHNGEIYNFHAVRRDLERRGHAFRTETDTEVLLAAYREYGVECLSRLRGMFAFAIWDEASRTLFAARDRLGQKPFYYRLDGDGLEFASEIKAFLANPGFRPTPRLDAISHYLTYQYVPTPITAFEGVERLPPGHYLQLSDGTLEVRRYWKLSYADQHAISEEAAAEELVERLREAVRLRLISDVPLGAFLSGGIDSGTIVAIMSQLAEGRVKTFSIGFDEKEYDELEFARLVARRYGTDHHEEIVKPDAVQILPSLVWHYDQPYADSSAVPTYYLARMTRRHVTVALNGDAGDESFAGYDRYAANLVAQRIDWLPSPARRALQRLARHLPGRRMRPVARAARLLEALGEPRERRYARWLMHFQPDLKADLCTPELREAAGDSTRIIVDAYAVSDAPDFVNATLDVDVNHYLPDDLLVKVDVATMAHGLEGRSPFLDHELMQFAARLPPDLKLRGRVKKLLLKRAARPLLPDAIIDRPKKGFGVPIEHWFRGELKEMAYDLLLDRRLRERGYFDMRTVERLLDEHTRRVQNRHYQLWNLLMLELWHRMFIDARPDRAPSPPEPFAAAGVPALHAASAT